VIIKLFACEDKSLLVLRDPFLVLDLVLKALYSVSWLHIKSDSPSSEGFDEYLHASSESEYKVESSFLLDVIVAESSFIIELLPSKDESLFMRRDAFFVLELGLNLFYGGAWLNV